MQRKSGRRDQRKRKKGAKPIIFFKRVLLLLLVIVAGAIFYELYSDRSHEGEKLSPKGIHIPKHSRNKQQTEREQISGKEVKPEPRETPGEETSVIPLEKAPPVQPAQTSGLRIAILIDDIGADISPVKNLLKIEAPISFAILPHTHHSVAAANMIHQAGRDILLHLPMEPQSYPKEKPGAGALFTAMSETEIRQVLREDLKAVPYISGVNNHMGSRFTENGEKLAIVMKELKSNGLFFIDSRTTPQSKARKVSRSIGTLFASRQIFIDNDQDYTKTCQTLLEVLNSKRGGHSSLILIGHPYPNTVEALAKVVPELKSRGVEIVPVSRMVQ
ncbi:MAG: Divergent polysaccharide deacetylase [Syntrophus sp. PtaB.Bin001]|nr:MAG: Divergent polysaccharide deacetylase [Syntrophus sp. PtaB.Bin001]